jgi:hypothetical protein
MPNDKNAEVATAASGPTSRSISTWREPIEIASKVLVAFIGLSYVIGLLILNLHVRKYGIFYLNFLHVEYVTVGILWICLVAWVSFLMVSIFHRCKQIWATRNSKEAREHVLFLVLTLFVGYSTVWYVLMVLTASSDQRLPFSVDWKMLGVLLFGAAGAFNIGIKLNDLAKYFRSERAKTNRAYKFFLGYDVLYYIVLLVVGLSTYAGYAFPRISPTFGGGKPQRAEFLIKKDRIDTVKSIGLQVPAEGLKVGPLEVVFEASDFFLIKPPQGFANVDVKAIRLNKDLIDAAFYIGS